MAIAKHHPTGTLKTKASGGKIDDLVLSSGDIVIVGAGGEAHTISAKMAGGLSDPKGRAIYVGTDIKRDSKTGHLVIGSIHKKGDLPVDDGVVIVGGKGTGKASLAGQVGIMKDASKEHIFFGHAVTVDPETGHFVTHSAPQRHSIKRDELRFYGGSAPSELRFHGEEDPSLEEGDIEKGYAFYTPLMNVPHHQKPYRLTWNVGERAAGTETKFESWGGASTELPMIVSGTGEEVAHVLDRTRDARVVAVRIENADEEQAAAAQRVFSRVAEFLPQLIETRQQEAFKKIIESLMPSVAPSASARAQIQMLVAARTSILKSGDFISPKEVAHLANYSASNPSVYPNKWKQSGKIFAIQNEGNDYFPFYALDPKNRYQPRPQVAEVLRVLGNTKDSWAIALWFASLNSFLDDERPQDVLATDPDRVVEAAQDERSGIQHG
jgi:hypothetical protein